MVSYQIPPDTRAVGTVDPAGDMNMAADMLGLLTSLFAQLAGAGTNADPAGNAANVTAAVGLRTAAALAPGAAGTILTSGGASSAPTFQPAVARAAALPSGGTSLGSNDTTALQSVIDAVWNAGGGVVFIPRGTYYITQLTLRSGVIIWGSGEGSVNADSQTGLLPGTILRAPSGNTSHMIIADPVPSSIAIPQLCNLTLDGNNGKVPSAFSYTATSASPCVFTASGNSAALGTPAYSNGNAVQLSGGTAPTGFTNATTYYVVSAGAAGNPQTFQLAATPGGTAINSTSTGSGTVTQNPQQTANAFDLIHITNQMVRFKFQNLTLYGSPGNGLYLGGNTSMSGAYVYGVNVQHAYGNGIYCDTASDVHFCQCETGVCGQNGIIASSQQCSWTAVKTNLSGALGLGTGTQDGWHITGGSNILAACEAENCAPAVAAGSGNGVYVSGNGNMIDVQASAAGNALLYLDGCKRNDIRLSANSQTNLAQPAYMYVVNGSGATTNKVRIKGSQPGTFPLTAYANLTSSGSELANDFECENEAATGRQTIAYAASITPDPYLGGHIKVGNLTGAITINNPANGHAGSQMVLRLTQDGTGGRVVTFGGAYALLGPAIPTTASTTTVIGFSFDGTTWNESFRNASSSVTLPISTRFAPADPASTVSTSLVMMGLAAGTGPSVYTPVASTKLRITVTGVVSAATASAGIQFAGRYGTGTAPANGAASTGTAFGAGAATVQGPVNDGLMMVIDDVITGLTVGTQIWIDVALKTSNAADAASLVKTGIVVTETN